MGTGKDGAPGTCQCSLAIVPGGAEMGKGT